MSLVTTATSRWLPSERQRAATRAVLPLPTGPPTPTRSGRWGSGGKEPDIPAGVPLGPEIVLGGRGGERLAVVGAAAGRRGHRRGHQAGRRQPSHEEVPQRADITDSSGPDGCLDPPRVGVPAGRKTAVGEEKRQGTDHGSEQEV